MLEGSFTALITPFDEKGEIDFTAFTTLVKEQVEAGSTGIVVGGSTGEGIALSFQELKELLQKAVKAACGKLVIIAGTGAPDTKTALEKTRMAKEVGANAALVIFPYYNKPTFAGCVKHFETLSEVGIPLIAYHHPGRTGLYLSPQELSKICSLDRVIALKEACTDEEHIRSFLELTNVSFFVGNDDQTLSLMKKGAKGVISVLGNLFPKEWNAFVFASLEENFSLAEKLYAKLEPLCLAMNLETNPQCIKYATSLKGVCAPYLRLPLLLPRDETKEVVNDAFLRFKSFQDMITNTHSVCDNR